MLVSKRQMQKETTSNHRQPLLDSGMRCGRPGYHSTSSKPSSAITGLGYVLDKDICLSRGPEAPDTKRLRMPTSCPRQPLLDKGMYVGREVSKPQIPKRPAASLRRPVLDKGIRRSRGPKKSRQRQQPAYQLARKQNREHQGAGPCLAVIEGRTHKYSSNAVYRSIRTGTSIVANMGQIGHDCQKAARLRPN